MGSLAFFKNSLIGACIVLGVALTAVNVVGLFKELRVPLGSVEDLRFGSLEQERPSYKEAMDQLVKHGSEPNEEYLERVTEVISASLYHIHWDREDSRRFNQWIPVWENYFLYLMGLLSGIAEFEKYHYTDFRRSIRRGIGICGDASMAMSQLLRRYDIDHRILAFPGHVVIEAEVGARGARIFDPDFGVVLPGDEAYIKQYPAIITEVYQARGYTDYDTQLLNTAYASTPSYWRDTKHFVTKKYYFERLSYFLKWPLPLVMIALGFFMLMRGRMSR